MVVIKITVVLSLIWVLFYIILRNKLKDPMYTLGLLLGDDGKPLLSFLLIFNIYTHILSCL